MKVSFSWNKSEAQIVKEKTGGTAGLLFLANTAKRLMDPYVPADNLVLAQNVQVYVEGDAGIVHYTSPYAHYQFKGEVYGPNYPISDGGAVVGFYSPSHKSPTGASLHYSTMRHPLATSEWHKAMATARGQELANSYENYLKGGVGG
mgnify:FL=1